MKMNEAYFLKRSLNITPTDKRSGEYYVRCFHTEVWKYVDIFLLGNA